MPASMIMAVAGLRLKVSGSNIATVATGPSAGQHADQGAEEDAEKAVEEVLQADRDAEAERQIGEDIHARGPTGWATDLAASQAG